MDDLRREIDRENREIGIERDRENTHTERECVCVRRHLKPYLVFVSPSSLMTSL